MNLEGLIADAKLVLPNVVERSYGSFYIRGLTVRHEVGTGCDVVVGECSSGGNWYKVVVVRSRKKVVVRCSCRAFRDNFGHANSSLGALFGRSFNRVPEGWIPGMCKHLVYVSRVFL